eukprot:676869-Amphidinium_carterae.1
MMLHHGNMNTSHVVSCASSRKVTLKHMSFTEAWHGNGHTTSELLTTCGLSPNKLTPELPLFTTPLNNCCRRGSTRTCAHTHTPEIRIQTCSERWELQPIQSYQ